MNLSIRRIAVIGLTGIAVLATGAGVANAGATPGHHPVIKTHHHPHAGAHAASTDTKTFATKRAGVQVRSMAGTGRGSRVVSTLGHAGSHVTVSCYSLGQPMAHDRVWYRTSSPAGAYVAGSDLHSGHDPATGVNHC